MDTLGRHLIAEFYGCDHGVLDDPDAIRAMMVAAAERVGATVLQVSVHRYAPQGVTATVIIAESHLSIHTWPEHGYAAADIFTCGGLQPRPGFVVLRDALAAKQTRVQVIVRGLESHMPPSQDVLPDDVLVLSSFRPLDELDGG